MGSERLTILVAEDDTEIGFLLGFMLDRQGFDVRMAKDGREALSLIEGLVDPPAAAVLDIMLPFADGYALVGAIRGRAGWGRVPILMLTAKSQEADIVRALDAGADDYLTKPFQPGELTARLNRLVASR